MSDYSYRFIINPHSGNKKDLNKILSLIQARFAAKNYEIKYSEYAGHAGVLVREALERKIETIVAIGGDGTLNEVGSQLVNSDSILGLIPRGSGNGFARSLAIPLNLQESIGTILHPVIKTIDTVKLNQDYYLGVAGTGFDAMIAHAFQNFGPRGPLPYFYLGTKTFFNYSYPEFRILESDQNRPIHPLTITVANTRQYGNGAIIAPAADYQDGLLDICVVQQIPFYKSLQSLRMLFNGKIDNCAFYSTFQTKKVVIENDSSNGIYHMDGEPRTGGQVLRFEIVPKSLQVITSGN